MINLLTSADSRSEDIFITSIVVPELEFGNIERQIFPTHFVECADHATLKNRPKAFDGLSMNSADDILTSGVINDPVRVFAVKALVARPLIGAEQADFVGNGFADEGGKSVGIHVCDYARNHISFTADRADDWSFAGTDAACSAAFAALIPMPVFGEAGLRGIISRCVRICDIPAG
jgi:hypothetical protein